MDAKTKEKRVADTGIAAPNGITLSPDQGTLAVSDYRGANVWTFRMNADGTLDAKAPYMTMRLPIDPKGEFKQAEPPPYNPASGGDGMTSDDDRAATTWRRRSACRSSIPRAGCAACSRARSPTSRSRAARSPAEAARIST